MYPDRSISLDEMPDMLTVEETAAYFGVSTGTIRRMIHDGRLARVKVGRLDRVPKRELVRARDGA